MIIDTNRDIIWISKVYINVQILEKGDVFFKEGLTTLSFPRVF